MFFSTSVTTGISSCESEHLPSSNIGSGSLSCGGLLVTSVSIITGISQSSGSTSPITPHLSPNRFAFFFGEQFTQDIDKIVIQKASLPGLTPSNSNTAESLLVGLLGKALTNKNTVSFPGITLTYWGYGRTNGKRIDTVLIDLRNKLTIANKFEIPDLTGNINPNHY